jgi:hypothetical protein
VRAVLLLYSAVDAAVAACKGWAVPACLHQPAVVLSSTERLIVCNTVLNNWSDMRSLKLLILCGTRADLAAGLGLELRGHLRKSSVHVAACTVVYMHVNHYIILHGGSMPHALTLFAPAPAAALLERL